MGLEAQSRVAFVTNASILEQNDRLYSHLASVRREIILAAEALRRQGFTADVVSLPLWPSEAAARIVQRAERVVFGKLVQNPRRDGAEPFSDDIRAYRDLLARSEPGKRFAFCFTDDHFDDPRFAAFYREMAPVSQAWIASSAVLAQRLQQETSCPVHVYPEPLEYPSGRPRVVRHGLRARAAVALARSMRVGLEAWRLKLLWFGHPANVASLVAELAELARFARQVPVLLECVTQPGTALDTMETPISRLAAEPLRIVVSHWSLEYMGAALSACHAVLLPQQTDTPARRAKSGNRLLDALHAGRFVVAHPLPAYAALGEYAWVGERLTDGLRWMLQHPEEALQRTRVGQAYVVKHHSMEAFGEFWRMALAPARSVRSTGGQA